MGACDFKTIGYGKDLQDAYKNAVESALYEHGHDSYNGTISTTSGVELVTDAPRYGTQAFRDWLNNQFDTIENGSRITKRGPALAVEIKGKNRVRALKQRQCETAAGV